MREIAGIVEVLERKVKPYKLTTRRPQKEGTAMNVIDRIILSSIALGIWAWVLITFLSGSHTDC